MAWAGQGERVAHVLPREVAVEDVWGSAQECLVAVAREAGLGTGYCSAILASGRWWYVRDHAGILSNWWVFAVAQDLREAALGSASRGGVGV